MRNSTFLTLALVTGFSGAVQAAELAKAQVEFFENKIRPIFSTSCLKCHSAAEGKVKGGFAMDTRDGLLKGGDTGPAVVPGNPDKSLLIKAISYKDADLQMPPKGEKLSDAQIADLIAWVRMGAPDPRSTIKASAKYKGGSAEAKQHWAYQPVKKQAPPTVTEVDRIQSPVDNFVAAKLEEKGMTLNKPADRATLIRRAYFDLIGIPPTPTEVQAFVNDKSTDAFAKVVDKLLESPHYGERWGRYWLDVARYSDTRGQDNRRNDSRYPYAWTYRDYVIKSFNEDKPYNRFIMEQVAADKIQNPDQSSLAALGFLTLGERFAGNQNDIINDRIDVVTKGFLAMTVACARCHDHMFDPIPTKDYYSLHGVFASCTEPKEMPIIQRVDANNASYRDYLQQRAVALYELHRDSDKAINTDLSEFRKKAGGYLMFAYADGKARTEISKKYELKQQVNQFVQGRVRRGGDRDPVLGPWSEMITAWNKNQTTFPAEAAKIAFRVGANQAPAPKAPSNKKGAAQPVAAKAPYNPIVAAAFKSRPAPKSIADVAQIYTTLFTQVDVAWQQQIKAAEATKTFPRPLANAYMEQIRLTPVNFTTSANMDIDEVIAMVPNGLQGRIRGLGNALTLLEMQHPGAPARATVLADKEKASDSPVYLRGEPSNRGETVPRRFLEVLSGPTRQPFKVGSGRLELAQSIASDRNPLTARVMANRIWMHHFGEGIVPTPDDFGTMSEAPSHPELLDFLAAKFVENGWSIKKMHRLIMVSSTYQQSSENNPRFAVLDPNNRLLWRANIRKLEFEAIRDTLLAISGKLDRTIGGKPVNITDEPYSFRRSVYGYIDRSSIPEVMTHFDFATPDMPMGRRYNTIVPQQALFMMNSPQVIDVTRHLVNYRADVASRRDYPSKIEALYEIIFQRKPRPEEVKLGIEFINSWAPAGGASPARVASAEPVAAKKGGKPVQAAANAKRGRPTAIVNQGEKVSRSALGPWEEYAQSLLLANEASYVN